MLEAKMCKLAIGHSSYQQPRDFPFAFCFAVVAALLHAYALFTEFARAAELTTLNSSTIPLLFLLIGLCLIANVAGLWLRKTTGILLSLGALAGVCAGYAVWYIYSRQILDLLLSKQFYASYPEAVPPHPFDLIGATWVNLVVLVMTVVLIIWEVTTLRGMLKTTPAMPDHHSSLRRP